MGIFRNIDLLLFIRGIHRDYSIISLWEGPLLVNCVNTTHSSPFSPNFLTAISASHLRRNRTFLVSNFGKVFVIGNSKFKVVEKKRLLFDHLKRFPLLLIVVQLFQFTLSKIQSGVKKTNYFLQNIFISDLKDWMEFIRIFWRIRQNNWYIVKDI